MIYLDNAATTKMSKTAIDAMLPFLDEIYGNPSSLHSAGQRAAETLASARGRVAECIGASAAEITFTSCGSEADNQAIVSAARLGAQMGKKHIISTTIEHHAVLHTLKKLEKEGFEVTLLDVDGYGWLSPEKAERAMRDDTCLVTVMYANNEIGTLLPISEIGSLCRKKGVVFHTDAVQAVGHLPINVAEQNIDMLSLSAHKFGGPKGIGALYTKKGIPLTAIIEGGAQERGKRAGTENVAAAVGMAAALDEACKNAEQTAEKLLHLRAKLIDGLSAIPHSVLNGHAAYRLPSNVNFCFEGIEGESLLLLLDDKGICASSGSACTSDSLDPSHVLLAIGRPHEIAHGSLRLSLSADNTEEEIEYTLQAVKEAVEYLRGISPIWRECVNGKREFVIKE